MCNAGFASLFPVCVANFNENKNLREITKNRAKKKPTGPTNEPSQGNSVWLVFDYSFDTHNSRYIIGYHD